METTTDTPKKGTDKRPMSFNITAEARRLLVAMGAKSGLSQTSVIELAIRERAEREGVQ